MAGTSLAQSLERAERALARIERAAASLREAPNRDRALRAEVQDVVAELDRLVREAGGR